MQPNFTAGWQVNRQMDFKNFYIHCRLTHLTCVSLYLHNQNEYGSAKAFQGLVQVKYMLSKNTPGVKKSEAKSEAPVSSYSYMRLKSVISG